MILSNSRLETLIQLVYCHGGSAKEAWRELQSHPELHKGLEKLDKETFVRPNGLYDAIKAYFASPAFTDKKQNVKPYSELRRLIDNPSLTQQQLASTPENTGPKIGVYVMVIVVLGLIITPFYYLLTSVSDSMNASSDHQRVGSEFDLDGCIKRAVSSCESACETDPITAYCGIMTGGSVVGSGCTREMKPLKYSEQVERCKATACGKMETQAWEHCYNQMK